MKALRIVLLAALAAMVVPVAQADQLPVGDPVVKTGGGHVPAASPGPVPASIITTMFTIESPSGTSPGTSACDLIQGGITTVSPECFFQNDITTNGVGETIGMLTFDVGISSSGVNCGFLSGSPFTQCGVDSLGPDSTQISFYGGTISYGTNFTLDFEGFPANTSFGGTASTVPEPGTLALVGVFGLAMLIACRRISAGSARQ